MNSIHHVSPPILISMTKNMNMIKKGRIEKKKLEHDQLELKIIMIHKVNGVVQP
jgi:hypothetical protein